MVYPTIGIHCRVSPFATCPTARVSCALLKLNHKSRYITRTKGKAAAERLPLGDPCTTISCTSHLGLRQHAGDGGMQPRVWGQYKFDLTRVAKGG